MIVMCQSSNINILLHSYRFNVPLTINSASFSGLITMKLKAVNRDLRQNFTYPCFLLVDKQSHHRGESGEGINNFDRLLNLNVAWTGRVKHQANCIYAFVRCINSIFNTGKSANFNASSHKVIGAFFG